MTTTAEQLIYAGVPAALLTRIYAGGRDVFGHRLEP